MTQLTIPDELRNSDHDIDDIDESHLDSIHNSWDVYSPKRTGIILPLPVVTELAYIFHT